MIATIKVRNKSGEVFSNGKRHAYIRNTNKGVVYLYDEDGRDLGWTYLNLLEEVKPKKITLQLQNVSGEVQGEEEVVLNDNDTLIMQFPDAMRQEDAWHIYKTFKEALDTGAELLGMPDTISFKVIKIDKE